MRLSKSKFVAGCQCVKRLYWQVHEPELAAQRDAATDAIIAQGREVGLLARQMFPGGIEVSGNGGLYQAIRTTRELVANSAVPAIYEATFEHAGVLVRVDVLQRRRGDRRGPQSMIGQTRGRNAEALSDLCAYYQSTKCAPRRGRTCRVGYSQGRIFRGSITPDFALAE